MDIGSLKSLLPLWENLAAHHRYDGLVAERDLTTFRDRAINEGLSFLTSILPQLGQALDRFHSTKEWIPPSGFSLAEPGGFPIFLGKAFEEAMGGQNPVAVDCIRQLSYLFYKLEVPYNADVTAGVLDRFVTTDSALLSRKDLRASAPQILDYMRRVIARVLCNEDPLDIRPCHGSGATACRTVAWDKWHRVRYFPKLDAVYSYSDYFFFNPTHLSDELDLFLEEDEGIPRARVVLVPKDSRGPRVISCEPAELMYIQQGIMKKLYKIIETHPLTRGQVNFTDQSINRSLARLGSQYGVLSTIDMSDASDRVSLALVREVFPANWVRCLEACRSEETILPDGRVVELQKFAPMGSSCCFPVEALVFWAGVSAVTALAGDSKPAWVYGDDIIIESVCYDSVVEGLTSLGLKVNDSKSFKEGPFRESCGGDYYKGIDVTPVRVRTFPVSNDSSVIQCADLINNIVGKFGYEESARLIQHVEACVHYVYPRTLLPLPGTITAPPCALNDAHFLKRRNRDLQRSEYRIRVPLANKSLKRPPNWRELLRKELMSPEIVQHQDQPWVQLFFDRTIADIERSLWSKPWRREIVEIMAPGYYADNHSVHMKWKWTWLGEPGVGDA